MNFSVIRTSISVRPIVNVELHGALSCSLGPFWQHNSGKGAKRRRERADMRFAKRRRQHSPLLVMLRAQCCYESFAKRIAEVLGDEPVRAPSLSARDCRVLKRPRIARLQIILSALFLHRMV
jgi:hypothetical protein